MCRYVSHVLAQGLRWPAPGRSVTGPLHIPELRHLLEKANKAKNNMYMFVYQNKTQIKLAAQPSFMVPVNENSADLCEQIYFSN